MMRLLICAMLLAPVAAHAQGIQFDHELSWQQVQEKAKKENKYIFMDCWATWCGPCIGMNKEVFPQQAAGDFFNDKFINVKVQFDTTAKDNEYVKQWYADAHAIWEKFDIRLFPTFLFFSPDGKPVHRVSGGMPVDALIATAKDAMNPEKQYFTLLERFRSGDKDTAFLRSFAETAYLTDETLGREVGNAYIGQLKDLWTKTAAEVITKYTRSRAHPGFAIILSDTARFNALTAPHVAQRYLTHIIYTEEIKPHLSGTKEPNWKSWEKTIAKKYPQVAKETIALGKYYYYKDNKDWNKYAEAYDYYADTYAGKSQEMLMNNIAWELFEKTKVTDKKALNIALKWSKGTIAGNNPTYLDTYANLLYKLGRKEEALQWEQKAVDLAGEPYAEDLRPALEKMKANQPTWPQ